MMLGPGLASTARVKKDLFAEMLHEAHENQQWLTAISDVYRELNLTERNHLARAVFQDEINPKDFLAAFLAVEDDIENACSLAGLLALRFCRAELMPNMAMLRVEEESGEACLLRSLHGGFFETMRIAWISNEIKSLQIEPILHLNDVELCNQTSVREAIDQIAPLLWRHRKADRSLPEGAHRFADLF